MCTYLFTGCPPSCRASVVGEKAAAQKAAAVSIARSVQLSYPKPSNADNEDTSEWNFVAD